MEVWLKAFVDAARGIGRSVVSERNLKVHLAVTVLALVLCFALRVDAVGWCLVLVCIGAVIAAELFNTALESLCDRVCLHEDQLIKAAKDAAAGAVLVLSGISLVVGLIVYIPSFVRLLNG